MTHFSSMQQPVIHLDSVARSFAGRTVLKNIDLQISCGTVTGLVGLNGAGKTTLIRLMLGLLRPDQGTIRIAGFNPQELHKDFFRQVGVVLEHHGLNENCTLARNIHFFGQLRGCSFQEVETYLQTWWAPTTLWRTAQKVKTFSRGQKVQSGLCRAFLGWPAVFFLDEPVVALDMTAYDHFCGLVREARSRGAAILISSHQLDAIEELCDEVVMLKDGCLQRLSENAPDSQALAGWVIATSDRAEYAAEIVSGGGCDPCFQDGCWHFKCAGGTALIPGIITALVARGAAITEVRPETNQGLRDSIRRHYVPSVSEMPILP